VYVERVNSRGLLLGATIASVFVGCGAAPGPAPEPVPLPVPKEPAPVARRSAKLEDDCAVVAGKPPPEPLKREYLGLAKKARCQREVYTIMGGVTHFLGVRCDYCHVEPDYAAMTHNKQIANWMATQLIPRLAKNNGGDVWCRDCHVVDGKGTAKILGNPRSETWAVEWMTTHLVEDNKTRDGKVLRCKTCHQGNLGSPEFVRKVILTDHLPAEAP
jgi:hypothetical protein